MYNVHIEVASLVYIIICIFRFKNDFFPVTGARFIYPYSCRRQLNSV